MLLSWVQQYKLANQFTMFKYGFGNVYICKITKSDCWNLHLQGLPKEGSAKEVMTSFLVKDEQKKTFGHLHVLFNLICFSCLKRNEKK